VESNRNIRVPIGSIINDNVFLVNAYSFAISDEEFAQGKIEKMKMLHM
jgi:hypothetical protein